MSRRPPAVSNRCHVSLLQFAFLRRSSWVSIRHANSSAEEEARHIGGGGCTPQIR